MTSGVLHGDLTSFKLPDVLTFLNLSSKTGILTLSREDRVATVYFENGNLVFASSNQETLRLGAVLVKNRKFSKAQCDEVEAAMQPGGVKFGALAVKMGLLTEDELRDSLKIQVSEILYDCFSWNDGLFSFEDGHRRPDWAVTISINVASLLMEGARRIDEWERCLQLLPDSAIVFRVSDRPPDNEVSLSIEEWKVLFRINGARSLRQICDELDDDDLEIYRVVYGLYVAKLIVPVHKDDADKTTMSQSIGALELPKTLREEPVGDTPGATTRFEFVEERLIVPDDTNLLVSHEARLSFRDVIKANPARLLIKSPNNEFECRLEKDDYLIGRGAENQICLADSSASSFHARIFHSPAGYMIEDLGSRNGTAVNGTRIERRILQAHDKIQIGRSVLIYELP